MTRVKTSELTGVALDWAVNVCEGDTPQIAINQYRLPVLLTGIGSPSTDWACGGPIIEREGIEMHRRSDASDSWSAFAEFQVYGIGPTPLIAAMRCYVASRKGDVVELPPELA